MEVLSAALLVGSGMYLNSKEPIPQKKKTTITSKAPTITRTSQTTSRTTNPTASTSLEQSKEQATGAFQLQFFQTGNQNITNPNFDQKSLWSDVDQTTMNRVKARVNLGKKVPDEQNSINNVGFDSYNLNSVESHGTNEIIPSIDDIDRDIQMIHSNMTPFFGSTVKQNVKDTGFTDHILENFTGNYRHSRRDNKTEVEYLFDPNPNNENVYGAAGNAATNRDLTRFFPSATGRKNNELPFEKIRVGKGVADGYTARPSGGFHQDVRILPKTTEDLQVNPKITYESRILAGKFPTEKGRLIGQQMLKSPKAIMYNWNGERNFTGQSSHRKNRYRSDVILKCTNRDKLHSEYKGIAAPTRKSQNTIEGLRGKKRIAHKRNFLNTMFRNLTQSSGKKMNDLGKEGYENRPTERSMQSSRVHYTNVSPVGGKRGQQYSVNENGLRYSRKWDLIENRPGSSNTGTCIDGVNGGGTSRQHGGGSSNSNSNSGEVDFSAFGKAGPRGGTKGPVYNTTEVAKVTIRETTGDNTHHGFVGKQTKKGPVYDKNEVAKTTIRETTGDNQHGGFIGKHSQKGQVYNSNDVAKVTIRETTENNQHGGFVGKNIKKGPAYNNSDIAKVTIKETTEDNSHGGFMGRHTMKGKSYNQNEVANVTIRETTENNNHEGFVGKHTGKGPVYDQHESAKVTVRETTENNDHHGFVGRHTLKGKSYDEKETAKVTIRETTENSNYMPNINSGTLQRGGGYATTKWEAKNPQKAYLCNNEYVGAGEATTNKKPRTYDSSYNINTNKEQIAVGRAPNEVKNFISMGKEGYNLCINKLDLDREVPHILGKGTSHGNIYNPDSITRCSLTSRKNVTPTHIDRLQVDTLDQVKNNPLHINQSLN